jgi:hypothetical protein
MISTQKRKRKDFCEKLALIHQISKINSTLLDFYNSIQQVAKTLKGGYKRMWLFILTQKVTTTHDMCEIDFVSSFITMYNM